MLKILICHNNYLTSLPKLPEGLICLECCNNPLTSLPKLPESLEELYCGNNELTSLPKLPKKLTILWCRYNELTSLPKLPEKIKYIWCCKGNQLPNFGDINPKYDLELYRKYHNALIDFQRRVKVYLWRRNASLKERCRRTIIIHYYYDYNVKSFLDVPRDLVEYIG
jgi:Leucine-rich repeat (LRR) protein